VCRKGERVDQQTTQESAYKEKNMKQKRKLCCPSATNNVLQFNYIFQPLINIYDEHA